MVRKALFSPGELCGSTYEITETLEASPIAETYAATHRLTRAVVAITCSRFDHIKGDAPSIEAFRTSAERLQRLAIDAVPRIYDYGVNDGVYWIASQVLDDPTILEAHARLAGKPGSYFVEDSLSALLSIASILSAASTSNVVHGNLRPDLIVLRGLPNSCDPHLLELGFADLFMLSREAARMAPRYRSPEQLEGAPIDARSDIYALGMCLYALIAKAPPYADKAPDSNSTALLEMALRELPTPLPDLVTYCPDCVWRVIAKAIDKDTQKRFQAHGDFREAMSAVLDQVMALHDPVNVADIGTQGQDLVKAFRAYQESHGVAKDEATGATDTPRTLPPGIDTKRRVRAALAEARANVKEGAAPRVAAVPPVAASVALPAPPPVVRNDGVREEPAPLTGTAPESLSTAPTPRLPVNPALVRETIPAGAFPVVASTPTIAPTAAPITVRSVAPSAPSVVMPTPTEIHPPNAPSSEPSASVGQAGRARDKAAPRRIRWTAAVSLAMLMGIIGLRVVSLPARDVQSAHSGIQSAPARVRVAVKPVTESAPRTGTHDTRSFVRWAASVRTVDPVRKSANE